MPAERIFPISAATGQGVLDLVRAVRAVLDELGPQAVQYETNALNQTSVPARRDARVDDFTVSVEEVQSGAPSGECNLRWWGCFDSAAAPVLHRSTSRLVDAWHPSSRPHSLEPCSRCARAARCVYRRSWHAIHTMP